MYLKHLKEFFEDEYFSYILPCRLYAFLGAGEWPSEGECEWYNLKAILFPEYNQLYASRMQAITCFSDTVADFADFADIVYMHAAQVVAAAPVPV